MEKKITKYFKKPRTKHELVGLIHELHKTNTGWYKSSNSIITIKVGGISIKLYHRHGGVHLRVQHGYDVVVEGWMEYDCYFPKFSICEAYRAQVELENPPKATNKYDLNDPWNW